MTKKNLNFTQALKRLEEITGRLEDPNLDLEEGVELLEEGVRLHRLCKNRLTEASSRINTILKVKPAEEIGDLQGGE